MHSDVRERHSHGKPDDIRVILVDDEPLARLGMHARLQKYHDITVVAEASSSRDAIRKIRELQPDAVFLDIEMMGSSGLGVAHMLEGDRRPLVIFVTAHPQYALSAFDVKAIDYLLKPIDDVRLDKTIGRIRIALPAVRGGRVERSDNAAQEDRRERIPISTGKSSKLIDARDIDWIEAVGDYVRFHVQGKSYLVRESISLLLDRLPQDMLLRIHRSTIVNLDRVSDFIRLRNQDLLITLKDGTVLRCSRTFSDAFKKAVLQR